MNHDQSKTGFQGLRVGALESRMATEMERLITRHGGIPVVAPSMQELPLSDHPQALAFGETLLSGHVDLVVLLTGAGCRTLFDILETRFSLDAIKDALQKTILVVRGPKPAGVIKGLGLHPQILVPEPNTWKDILQALDASYPEGLKGMRVAVQEYGVSNPELLEGLRQRGAHVTPVPVYRWTLAEQSATPARSASTNIERGNPGFVNYQCCPSGSHDQSGGRQHDHQVLATHACQYDGGFYWTCGQRAATPT